MHQNPPDDIMSFISSSRTTGKVRGAPARSEVFPPGGASCRAGAHLPPGGTSLSGALGARRVPRGYKAPSESGRLYPTIAAQPHQGRTWVRGAEQSRSARRVVRQCRAEKIFFIARARWLLTFSASPGGKFFPRFSNCEFCPIQVE